MTRMRRLALVLPAALAGLAAASPATARDYGQQGTVWAIVEPDLLAQINTRLAALEASGETRKLNERLKQRTIARVVEGIVAQVAREEDRERRQALALERLAERERSDFNPI